MNRCEPESSAGLGDGTGVVTHLARHGQPRRTIQPPVRLELDASCLLACIGTDAHRLTLPLTVAGYEAAAPDKPARR